ncbi:MAG: hypothetical protein IJ386_05090 [Clostridia bacterium]|nr:hypothetical protein [Clostridia bacterium]
MSLQIMPNVEHIIVMILLPLAFIVLLFDITRHIGIRIITVLLTVALLYLGAVSIPVYHGVKEFNGEEYVGISDDSFSDWKFIYYYKTKFPLVISKDYEILEDYGIVLTSDWNVIKENGPYQIKYYEDGKCVETEYCFLSDPD